MKEELEKELFEDYPNLFKNKDNRRSSLMSFGFSYKDGWYKLTKALLERLDWYLEQKKEINFEIIQMKEKFAGLRCYFNGGDDYIRGVVSMAETISHTICEFCGNAGKPQAPTGWWFTLCEKCAETKKEEERLRLEEYKKKYGEK